MILRLIGLSYELDVLLASSTVNIIIVAIMTNVISYSLTPVLINFKNSNDRLSVNSTLLFIIVFVFVILSILQDIYSHLIVFYLFPGLTENINLLSDLYSIYSYVSIFSITNGLLTAICYSKNKILRTIIFPVLSLLMQTLFLFFYFDINIKSIAFSYFFSQLLITVLLFSSCFKEFNFKINIYDNYILLKKRVFPLVISSFFSKTDLIIDKNLLSTASVGSISSLHYSQLFINSFLLVLTKGISIVSLTKLSHLLKNTGKSELFFKYLNSTLFVTFYLAIFAISSFVINSFYFIEYIFNLFEINADVSFISNIILCLSGMFLGGALSTVIVNCYYVEGLNSFVAKTSVILHLLSIIFKIVFFNLYGFYVIPIIFSIKSIINFLILYFYYYKFCGVNNKVFFSGNLYYLINYSLIVIILNFLYLNDILNFYLFQIISLIFVSIFLYKEYIKSQPSRFKKYES